MKGRLILAALLLLCAPALTQAANIYWCMNGTLYKYNLSVGGYPSGDECYSETCLRNPGNGQIWPLYPALVIGTREYDNPYEAEFGIGVFCIGNLAGVVWL